MQATPGSSDDDEEAKKKEHLTNVEEKASLPLQLMPRLRRRRTRGMKRRTGGEEPGAKERWREGGVFWQKLYNTNS